MHGDRYSAHPVGIRESSGGRKVSWSLPGEKEGKKGYEENNMHPMLLKWTCKCHR